MKCEYNLLLKQLLWIFGMILLTLPPSPPQTKKNQFRPEGVKTTAIFFTGVVIFLRVMKCGISQLYYKL